MGMILDSPIKMGLNLATGTILLVRPKLLYNFHVLNEIIVPRFPKLIEWDADTSPRCAWNVCGPFIHLPLQTCVAEAKA